VVALNASENNPSFHFLSEAAKSRLFAKARHYTVATPYFNIWIGGPAPSVVTNIDRIDDGFGGAISSAVQTARSAPTTAVTKNTSFDSIIGISPVRQVKSFKQAIEELVLSQNPKISQDGVQYKQLVSNLLSNIKSVTVVDSVLTTDTFDIVIQDPDLIWISKLAPAFLNLGDIISIELGYAEPFQGEPGFENKITGRITSVDFNVPQNGVPEIKIHGMNFSEYLLRLPFIIEGTRGKWGKGNKQISPPTGDFVYFANNNLDGYLREVVLPRYGLTEGRIDTGYTNNPVGVSGPVKVKELPDSVRHLAGNVFVKKGKVNDYGNLYEALSYLASTLNCVFFVKGTNLYFFSHENLQTAPPRFPLHWRSGLKNLLSFNVSKVGQDTAGFTMGGYDENGRTQDTFIADAVDAVIQSNLGEIRKRINEKANYTLEDAYADARKNPVLSQMIHDLQITPEEFAGYLNMKKNVLDKMRAADYRVNLKTGEKVLLPMASVKGPPGEGGERDLGADSGEKIRRLLYFVDAQATALGDIELRAGTKVAVSITGEDTTPVVHSGISGTSIDGPWYLHEVQHTITHEGGYKCDLTLKKYWDVIPANAARDANATAITGDQHYALNLETKQASSEVLESVVWIDAPAPTGNPINTGRDVRNLSKGAKDALKFKPVE
jgi:hypothetical protein